MVFTQYYPKMRSKQAMKFNIFILVVFTISTVYCSAIPTNEKKHRSHEKSLSDEDHNTGGHHNPDYDHDAFLGHDEAETFDQLSPEESKARLAIIVDKIDKNKDGVIVEQELKDWIQYVQRRYIVTDTERMWKDHEPEYDDTLNWESYQKRTFGYSDEPKEGSPTFEYKDMIERDLRRWQKADHNSDGKLSKEEFQDFLHPEEAEHMRDIVVMETLEDIDKDGDGHISLQEYIDDIWGDDEDDEDDEEGETDKDGEPEWVKTEREQFTNYRDKDHDGKLNKQEIKEWIIPEDYDHSSAEAAHLVRQTDENRDGKLTKEEILEKYDLFVGSQATDFGEALTKHDEF
ncbi:calumenin isoform X1 [Aplysia californica]|uniref:Calumenin isoform X1 n=2 Tax=Aplysia californica TaxID=6500 RepID=A0ABM0K740_APLCA|nr:calumenin isoform X1 [Aplysia californica]